MKHETFRTIGPIHNLFLKSVLLFFIFLLSLSSLEAKKNTATSASLANLKFTGTYRKMSKTSIVLDSDGKPASYQQFTNLDDLISTFKPDDDMRSQFPGITDVEPELPRTDVESKNVEVEAFIYGAKLESDNDLHVVIASTNDLSTAHFLNTEVAGLPSSAGLSIDSLKAARAKFLSLFPNANFRSGTYAKLGLKKIRIRGSLIFDADHHPGCANCPGPKEAKPQTVWEIHPVTGIDLLEGSPDNSTSGSGAKTTPKTHHKHSSGVK